jgi:hypothetical protein
MSKHSRMLLLLLALVLPAQGLMAALLHCQLLEAAGSVALSGADATTECHGLPDGVQNQSPGLDSSHSHQHLNAAQTHSDSGSDCVHCAATCHGVLSVILPEFTNTPPSSPDFSGTAYLAQIILNIPENPLRPPRHIL